jgi:hypothetical protein
LPVAPAPFPFRLGVWPQPCNAHRNGWSRLPFCTLPSCTLHHRSTSHNRFRICTCACTCPVSRFLCRRANDVVLQTLEGALFGSLYTYRVYTFRRLFPLSLLSVFVDGIVWW